MSADRRYRLGASGLLRLGRILWVVSAYRLDLLIPRHRLPWPVRALLLLGPWRLLPASGDRGERVADALEALGPIFVKFGQLLSTRRDLLAEDIADGLQRLQDQVEAFDAQLALDIVEKALGGPVDSFFVRFDREPLASASVAQIHGAALRRDDGSTVEVVVKVVRPGIEVVIARDIALMMLGARLVQRYLPDGPRLRPVEVVTDYERVIFDELDMQREAANTALTRRNFADSELLYVPEVFWDCTRRNLLTLERIHGLSIGDQQGLEARGVDMKVLAERGVEIFFDQVFRDNFFHADMHPGNIFVDAGDPARPSYINVDFAICGSLSEEEQYYLARMLLAMFNRDYRKVAELHLDIGWISPTTRVEDFEMAIRATCEPIFQKPLQDIMFGELLIYLFQTARRFDMQVQPSLVLLQKTLLNIEGLGRRLYPQLDLWETAKPFLERWLAERYNFKAFRESVREWAPELLEQARNLPRLASGALHQGQRLERAVAGQRQALDDLQRRLDGTGRRRGVALFGVLALTGGVVLAAPQTPGLLLGAGPLAWVLGLVGLYLLVWRR